MKQYLSILSYSSVIPSDEPQWADAIPAALKRRDPRILQLAYCAAAKILHTVSPHTLPKSVVVATALGALDETKCFLDGVFGDGFGSPRNFINSVHNSIAGKIALEFKIGGTNLTFCDSQNSLASAIQSVDLLTDDQLPALLVCIDERLELLDTIIDAYNKSGKITGLKTCKDGAIGFLLGKPGTVHHFCIRACGPVPAYSEDPRIICKKLSDKLSLRNSENMLFFDQDISGLNPALKLFDFISSGEQSSLTIGSYSPVSHGVSVIEVINGFLTKEVTEFAHSFKKIKI